MLEHCPNCGNNKIVMVGGEEIEFKISVSTGKYLKREKKGYKIWWQFQCKCGWENEVCTH